MTIPAGGGDPVSDLRASLEGAKALIEMDDAHGARAQVIQCLDDVEVLCGRDPLDTSGMRLAERLGGLDPASVTAEAGEVIAQTLRLGLRSAMQANDVATALPFGRAALRFADHLGLPVLAAQAHNDLATVYGVRDFHERAIHHLRSGIEELERAGEPVLPALVNNLGNVYMESDRVEEALACFDRAVKDSAEREDVFRSAIALANRGRALGALRRHAAAIESLESALGMFRSLGRKAYVAATLAKLGTAHAATGDLRVALRLYEEAKGLSADESLPFRGEVAEGLGRVLLEAGRYAEALPELELAADLHPQGGAERAAADMLREQARALSLMGRYEEAYDRLERHLEASEALQRQHGEVLVGVLLVELEAGLAQDNELPIVTGRVLAEANRALRAQAERLERMSATDELTQVHNRRFLNGRLEDEVGRCRQDKGTDLCLVLFDIDNFKAINDRYSHIVGDEVLKVAAQVLDRTFRRTDVVARWGGEEFAVLLVGTGKPAAGPVTEKAREAIKAAPWAEIADDLEVTVSAGIAAFSELEGAPQALELLKLADRRLYEAKRSGRDRVSAGG
ncbi:MAG TPA: GGDEF domain-containing protein [Trueperaceae bacterium]